MKKMIALVCCLVLGRVFALESTAVPDREGTWEFSLPLIYSFDDTIDGSGGSKVELEDDVGFGFWTAYFLTDQLSLGGSFNWFYQGYKATGMTEGGEALGYNNHLERSSIALNATYYILPGAVTPFVTGSIGYTFVDTNIPTGDIQEACYYDPWWGYTCGYYPSTRVESDFSYGLGVGIRGDVSESFSMQLSYNTTWYDLGSVFEMTDFGSIRLDFVFHTF